MNCTPSVEKNKEILKDLLKLDPVKYKNFDNVAKFILDAPISNENKSVSLNIISQLFVALNQKNQQFELGANDAAHSVARKESLLVETTKHLNVIKRILNYKGSYIDTFQELMDTIDSFVDSGLENYSMDDYESTILKPIYNYFITNTFVSETEKAEKITEVQAKLNDVRSLSPLESLLEGRFEDFIGGLRESTLYINANKELENDETFNTYLLTLSTNEVVEAVRTPDGIYYDAVTELPIMEEDIVTTKKALYQRDSENTDDKISHVFYPNDFVSGLSIRPFTTTERYEDLVNTFNDIVDTDSEVKIYAVKLNEYTDERINRLKEIDGLENKDYETFESESQSEFLKTNPDGSIITVLREKKSTDKFALVGEITNADGLVQKFYIQNMTNFGILNADNSVSKLDFTNNDHLNRIQELSVFKQNGKSLDLDQYKLAKLKALANKFNKFKNSIVDKVEASPLVSVDITEDFNSAYKIEKNHVIKNIETLDVAKATSPNIFFSVEVAKVDTETGEVLSTETKELPFHFSKSNSRALAYLATDFLNSDEAIQYEGQLMTFETYLNTIGITEEFVTNNVLKGKEYPSIFLSLNANGEYSYRVGKYFEPIGNEVLFTKFVSDMVMFTNSPNAKNIFNNSFFNKYTFRPKSNKDLNYVLNVDFALSQTGELQLEIRPYSKNHIRYSTIINASTKKDFNFPLGKNLMNNLLKSIVPSQAEYSELQSQYDFFNKINIYKADGSIDTAGVPLFIDAIFSNTIIGKNQILENVINNIKTAKETFNKAITESVVDVIKDPENSYDKFLTLVNEDFTDVSNILFNKYEGNLKVPFVRFGKHAVENVQDTLEAKMDNYVLVNNTKSSVIITTRNTVGPSESMAPVINSVKPVAKNTTKEITPVTKEEKAVVNYPKQEAPERTFAFEDADNLEENDNEIPFSTLTEEERQLASQHDIDAENNWFAKTYSEQFSIESLDQLSDFIKLTQLDGNVLGAFKDNVIYLNEQLRTKGVLYHETFHGVFRTLLSEEKRRELLDTIIRNKKYNSSFSEAALTKFASDRNIPFEKNKVIDLVAEEILAEGFQSYMIKAVEPKTLIQKFFAMLKDLITFFLGHSNHIDNAYEKIRTGKIASQVKTSGIYNNEIAFLSIPGLIKNTIDSETGKRKQIKSNLLSKHQNELVDSVVSHIIENTSKNNSFIITGKTFDQKFDEASDYLLEYVWNIDNLLNQVDVEDVEKRKAILEKYGERYNNYAFMLGGRMKGQVIYDLNDTGDSAFDKKLYNNKVKVTSNEPLKDNNTGSVSYYMLKELVKKKHDAIIKFVEYDEDLSDDEVKELDNLKVNGEARANNPQNEYDDEQDDSNKNAYEDQSLAEKGGLQSLPKEIRESLSIIRYTTQDKDLNILVPRHVDGYEMFGVLLKISSDTSSKDVLENIKTVSETLLDDNIHYDEANDLFQIYNYIKEKCEVYVDEEGVTKIKNSQFYNIFVDTVIKASVDYIMFDVDFKKPNVSPVDSMDDAEQPLDTNVLSKMVKYNLKDKILTEDINRKKNMLVSELVSTYNQNKKSPEYVKALKALYVNAKKLGYDTSTLSNTINSTGLVDKMAEEMSENFKTIGLKLPKSLIRMSIIAIEKTEKGNFPILDKTSTAMKHYDANESFVLEGKYLQKDFFIDLIELMKVLNTGQITGSDLAEYLEDNENMAGRFNIILRNAAAYIAKYDPTELPSVYRNAEGKPVYRYLSYTPVLLIAQDIRRKGIISALKEDEFYENSKAYFDNNPFLKDVFEGTNSEMANKMAVFFKNFDISLFGGVAQSLDDNKKDGKVFKNLDEHSQQILNLLSFLKRTTTKAMVNKKDVVEITTFKRMFTTIESTNTNYLLPALYEKYVGVNGIITDEKGIIKPTYRLVEKVAQEYARILDESATILQLKKEFDGNKKSNGKRLLNNYNAKLDGNKADITNEKLRAFNFSYLPVFWNNNPELKQRLIDSAKSGINFSALPTEVIDELTESLNQFALNNLEDHKATLVREGIIKPHKTREGVYTSSVLPTKMITNNNQKVNLISQYGNLFLDFGNVVADSYFNFWINSIFFNEILDGDIALGTKNSTDYIKRQKRNAASNSNMKEGFHKVAYIDTLVGYIHPEHLGFGPYFNVNQIKNDPKLNSNPDIKKQLIADYGKKIKIKGIDVSSMHDLFDGQSVSLLMHHADMYDKIGRLNPKIENLIIKKHYTNLTDEEVKYLQKNKVVLNSKKTVTASRSLYHKLSEVYIDRGDVSYKVIPNGLTEKEVDQQLHALYSKVYNLRLINNALLRENDFSKNASTEKEIKKLMVQIHNFFAPMPHREKLHTILNSMEYNNIDQLMDTTASKLATVLPTDVNYKNTKGYINLERSSIFAPNQFKFWQVETSGIKSIIKYSVQSKVLLPANLKDVTTIIENNGEVLSSAERDTISQEMNDILFDYHSTLKDVAESHETLMKTLFSNKGDQALNVGFMFDLIRKNLSLQEGVSDNKLKLFETDPITGKPIHSSNLPEIRDMLEYYFFSQYSKFVDEKGTGSKYIHMAAFGYDVMSDENGNTVFTDDYKKDPSLYPNHSARPLGISIEKKNGKNVYYVECIVPKPLMQNPKLLEKYKDTLLKMFGTRIPTEDKRSMVALKVVDYMDSANLSGIIVPQLVHILSGSDLDIDTLYTQQYSFYKNFDGRDVLYGDYSDYSSVQNGQFVEYLNYMSKEKDFSPLIKDEVEVIKNSDNLVKDQHVINALKMIGYKTDAYDLDESFAMYKDTLIDNINIDDVLHELDVLFKSENDESEKINQLLTTKKMYYNALNNIRYINSYIKVQGVLNVLSAFKLPNNISSFSANPDYSKLVKNKFQNANLDAKLNILTNENVFNNLFINERSSTQMFLNILKTFGIDLDEQSKNFDPFTIDGVISSRTQNVLSKLGIGVTANINKTLAFLSQYFNEDLDGNIKEPVWNFRSGVNEEVVSYNKLGGFNTEQMRSIALIGNILGMFADGAKEPIPAALNLNEINSPITLSMIGLGINPNLVLAINFIPEIKNAIQNVQQTQYAVSNDTGDTRTYLVKELRDTIRQLNIKGETFVLNELKDKGLVNKKSGLYDMNIIYDNLIIEYTEKAFDQERLKNNTLSLSDLGIEISTTTKLTSINTATNDVEDVFVKELLSEDAQKLILLSLYKSQSEQTAEIKAAGNIVNMFKRINPNFNSFDKLKTDVKNLKIGNSVIEDDVVKRIFDKNQVWSVIDRIITDIDDQSKMFIERSDVFKPIKDSFEYLFKDKKVFAKTVTSYVALQKFKKSYIKDLINSPVYNTLSEATKELKVKEAMLIDKMFKADYWYNNNLDVQLKDMQLKYPDNELLKRLRILKTNNVARNTKDTDFQEQLIIMTGKAKLSGRALQNVEDDANTLYVKEPLFFKQLFFHELVRTGLRLKDGSFLQYLNPDFKLPLSKYIDDFTNTLAEAQAEPLRKEELLMKYLDTDKISDVHEFMKDMFVNLIFASTSEIDNNKIRLSYPSNITILKNNIDFSQLQDAEEDLMEELFSHVLPLEDSYSIYNKNGMDVLELMDETDNIVMNFNVPGKTYGNITNNNMKDIASALNVKYDKALDKYIFPSALKVGNSYYLLQGVDSKAKNNVGENLMNVTVLDPKHDFLTDYNTGRLAIYKKLPRKPDDNSLSTVALDLNQIKRYADLSDMSQFIDKKAKKIVDKQIKEDFTVEKLSKNAAFLNTNIVYAPMEQLRDMHNKGELIYTMRVSEKQEKSIKYGFKNLGEFKNFGNPFTGTDVEGLIKMNSIEDAVEAYEEWLDGKDIFVDKFGKQHSLENENVRRKWILSEIVNLKKQAPVRLGYFKEGYRSHADVINERINGKEKISLNAEFGIRYYEGDVTPEPNTVFVFGSNPQGRHGAGAAKIAKDKFGAINGQGEGLQGNAYALPTKDLRIKENRSLKSISPKDITESIKKLYKVAEENPNKDFKIAFRNTEDASLNGYTGYEMIHMFNDAGYRPSNIVFSKEWVDSGRLSTPALVTTETVYNIEAPDTSTLEGLLTFLGAKKVSKGMLNIDGQHWYLNNDNWGVEYKSGRDELFLYTEQGEEIFVGTKKDGEDFFTSEYEPVEFEQVRTLTPTEKLQNDILKLNYDLEAYHNKIANLEYATEMIVANNLGKLLPESVKKETGLKTGNTKDIPTSMLSKNGVTVDQAAHNIWQGEFGIDSDIKTEEIKDIIIDILNKGGIAKYKDELLQLDLYKSMTRELREKESELKKLVKPVTKPKPKKKLDYGQATETKTQEIETSSTPEYEANLDALYGESEAAPQGMFNFDIFDEDPEIDDTTDCNDVPF